MREDGLAMAPVLTRVEEHGTPNRAESSSRSDSFILRTLGRASTTSLLRGSLTLATPSPPTNFCGPVEERCCKASQSQGWRDICGASRS